MSEETIRNIWRKLEKIDQLEARVARLEIMAEVAYHRSLAIHPDFLIYKKAILPINKADPEESAFDAIVANAASSKDLDETIKNYEMFLEEDLKPEKKYKIAGTVCNRCQGIISWDERPEQTWPTHVTKEGFKIGDGKCPMWGD